MDLTLAKDYFNALTLGKGDPIEALIARQKRLETLSVVLSYKWED